MKNTLLHVLPEQNTKGTDIYYSELFAAAISEIQDKQRHYVVILANSSFISLFIGESTFSCQLHVLTVEAAKFSSSRQTLYNYFWIMLTVARITL